LKVQLSSDLVNITFLLFLSFNAFSSSLAALKSEGPRPANKYTQIL
jgi:hypothetical protein